MGSLNLATNQASAAAHSVTSSRTTPMILMVFEMEVLKMEVRVVCFDLKCASVLLDAMVVNVIIPAAIITITTARITDIHLL